MMHQYNCEACDDYEGDQCRGWCLRYKKFIDADAQEVCNSNLAPKSEQHDLNSGQKKFLADNIKLVFIASFGGVIGWILRGFA